MPIDHKQKKAVLNVLKKMRPLMDVDAMKMGLLGWLEQFEFPAYPDNHSWSDCIKVFPTSEEERLITKGIRLRLAVKLFTTSNQYIISIMESLNPGSREVYIISVHVNWNTGEKRMQKLIEESYTGQFDDALRAKHSIWTQTFTASQLHDALNSCAASILGNELTGNTSENKSGEPINIPIQVRMKFPKQDD